MIPASLCEPRDWRWPITIVACWLVLLIAYDLVILFDSRRPRRPR